MTTPNARKDVEELDQSSLRCWWEWTATWLDSWAVSLNAKHAITVLSNHAPKHVS